jgi:hypothetical protein
MNFSDKGIRTIVIGVCLVLCLVIFKRYELRAQWQSAAIQLGPAQTVAAAAK